MAPIPRLQIISVDASGNIVAPRTKKNSPMIVRGMKHPILLPSEAYREWEKGALLYWIKAGICKPMYGEKQHKWTYGKAINYPVNCKALIYRHALVGDAIGYYQAIADFLEKAGVVENDKYIVRWWGSEMYKDPIRPRVEVELTAVAEVQVPLFDAVEVAG